MIAVSVLNNILYYLNIAALLHLQSESNRTTVSSDENNTVNFPSLPVILQQIPPGPIASGAVVKFICSVGGHNNVKCGSGAVAENEVSYEWEMYQYVEDKNGNVSKANVVKLPNQDAELEMKFNDSVSTNPSAKCDLVCKVKNNSIPSSASIKLTFKPKDALKAEELMPPSNFKMLDINSRTAYFSWNPPKQLSYRGPDDDSDSDPVSDYRFEDIVGYIIEYKNGRGTVEWRNERVSRYEVKDADSYAACISNLKPWTTYHFRIMSCSKTACSKPSPPIVLRTLEDLPSGSPVAVKAIAIDERTLEVSWKPPPRSTWNGALLGYNVGLKRSSSPEDEPYVIQMFDPLEIIGNVYVYRTTVSDTSVPYKVVVQAFNNIGGGPFSDPVTQIKKFEFQNELVGK